MFVQGGCSCHTLYGSETWVPPSGTYEASIGLCYEMSVGDSRCNKVGHKEKYTMLQSWGEMDRSRSVGGQKNKWCDVLASDLKWFDL